MDELYLGIDLGTSATKTVLVRADGQVVARGVAAHPDARTGQAGRVDPTPWMRSLAEACAALGPSREQVTALSVAVHSPVALFLDGDGVPICPGVRWEHPSLGALCAAAAGLRTPEEARLVANRTEPATAMALAWPVAAGSHPELSQGCATFGLVGTWLGQFLTGQAAIDPTQASYLGIMAATDGAPRWLDDLAERYGVPAATLPAIRPSLDVLGPLLDAPATTLGLPAGIPVVVGAADTASAAYLMQLEDGGPPLYTVGTTHVITSCRTEPEPVPLALSRTHVVPGRWLAHGAVNGGDALALGARLLGHGTGGDAVRRMTAAAGGALPADAEEAPVFIPHTAAERGPLWLREPHTALLGLLPHTPAPAAAWGITEGVAFASRLVLEMCTEGRLAPGEPVVLAGTFAAGDAYPQIVADALGRPVRLVDESHLPAMGAAAMAASAVDGVALPRPAAQLVEPRPEWAATVAHRWRRFARQWSTVVGRPFPVDVPDSAPLTPAELLAGSPS